MVGDKPNRRGPQMQRAHEGDGGPGRKRACCKSAAAQEIGAWALIAYASFDRTDLRILELMGCGLADSTIGKRLNLSHRTIQRRIQRMMMQTGALGRFSLGLRVSELGLVRTSHFVTDREFDAPGQDPDQLDSVRRTQ